jgi:hypothetical protein
MPATNNETVQKEEMKTLASCLNSLSRDGFTTQFKATSNGLTSLKTEKVFQPNEVKIIHFYRFEGESDPSDNSIVYGIETKDGEKGTLVDAYGPYSDSHVTKFMQQVKEIHK